MAPDYDENAGPLDNIARGLFAIARALDRLGTGNAATPMGAIELLASEVKALGETQRGATERLAEAIENR